MKTRTSYLSDRFGKTLKRMLLALAVAGVLSTCSGCIVVHGDGHAHYWHRHPGYWGRPG